MSIALVGETFSPKVRAVTERWLRRRSITLPEEAWNGVIEPGTVIVPLGWGATSQYIEGLSGEFEKVRGYVATGYMGRLIVPTFSPSEINQGRQRYIGVFLHDIERALRVAQEGWRPTVEDFVLDCGAARAEAYAQEYEAALAADPEGVWLAYDIETPYKMAGGAEDKAEFDDPTYTILRISFSWGFGHTISIPWSTEYIDIIRRLLASPGIKLVWNGAYDNPRLRANGFSIGGWIWDGMWGWHVLNSALEKSLAFVATFYCPDQPRWKHLAGTDAPRYSAIDAIVTWRCLKGIVVDLHTHNQWTPFNRHTVMLDVPLVAMTTAGMPLDPEERFSFFTDLSALEVKTQEGMEAAVPRSARQFQDLTRPPLPSATDGRVVEEIVKELPTLVCPQCGHVKPPKAHFKAFKKKSNPCAGLAPELRTIPQPRWRRYNPFTPSVTQMKAYQAVVGHDPVYTKDREKKVTFNEDAIKTLMRRYPDDRLYPQVLDDRALEKLLGTYVGRWEPGADAGDGRWVGGLPVGADGRVHTTYTHNPSTLRLSSQAPNLQNIPRAAGSDLSARVKALFRADPGCWLLEVDYAAIEAVLVGYFARSPTYIRLAKLGVHDYLNSHILYRDKLIPQPADLSWSDADLKAFFKDLKKRFELQRDIAKRIVHLSNYGGTAPKIQGMHPDLFPTVKDAIVLQRLYFDVCPDVKRWQNQVVAIADRQGFLRNPYEYVHRFWKVQAWTQREGEWFPSWGEDAKAALAFLPQSTAAGIIKEAILRLWYERPPEVGAALRLQVHDSLVAMIPKESWDQVAPVIWETMKEPIPQLPLPPEWGMGTHLVVNIEAKRGERWKGMEVVA